jgi:hypothetical protein
MKYSDEEIKDDIKSGASLELIHSATGLGMDKLLSLQVEAEGEMFNNEELYRYC